MPRYKVKTQAEGSESEYESDGETSYFSVKRLGEGRHAQARLFQSKTESEKMVAVLNPASTPGDLEEARIKYRFFQTVYPHKQSHLFTMREDYRLVVPYIPYVPYSKLVIDSPEFQKTLFRSAALALQDCHDKHVVVMDLKTDTIYYDRATEISYLIDGGYSVPTGTPIDAFVFQKSSSTEMNQYRQDYWHISPECWSVRPTPVLATPKMDIYSLGVVMYDLLINPTAEIDRLINRCLEADPINRPSLGELISDLEFVYSEGDRAGCII